MSGIVEFFNYVYVTELAGIDAGEKCLGPGQWHGTKGGIWDVGCVYGVTIGSSGAGWEKAIKTGNWRQDPCVIHCGIWHRVKRLIGKFKAKTKFEFHTPIVITSVRGTAFTVDVADDGTTLIAVLEGKIEVIDKKELKSIIINGGQQITVTPQKPLAEPCEANKDMLAEIAKWKENIINEESIEELEIPENTVIEFPKGRLNYASSGSEKGG